MADDEISVLYKHGNNGHPAWRMSQPNLDHKPLTQDQMREMSMKYLSKDDRTHFQLNTRLNRKGSLFGPNRDQPREKTPPYAKNHELEDDGLRVEPTPSLVSIPGAPVGRSAASLTTMNTRVVKTNRSVRGSAVSEDMRLLASLNPSANGSESESEARIPVPAPSEATFTHKKHEIDATFFKIEDWLKLELKGEYLGKRKHFLRVVNTLDYDEKVMQVSNYLMLHELVDFYAENYNCNAHKYLWKDIWGNTLRMNKSLGENGLMDNSLIIDELGLDHFPTILLYFMDGFENEPLMRLDISSVEPDGITIPCRNY